MLGFAVLMILDRRLWFTADEWDFIVYRGFHHPALGFMTPHNEHWSALPIVIWRAVFTVVGLHHYWPYLMFVMLAHVVALHLLWRLTRRCGVDPWLATAMVAAAVPLGIGYENLTYAFQIGFVGSIAFGMGAVLAALDLGTGWRPGRRLIGVWVLAVLGLTCSGIGVTMVVAAATVTLVVRGLRPAILVASVPALVYGGWYDVWGRTAVDQNMLGVNGSNYHKLPDFVANGLSSALSGWLDFGAAGPTAIALLILVVAIRRPRGVGAIPLAFMITTGVFFLVTAAGRVGAGVPEAAASRYSYIAIFLLLPVILSGLQFLVDRGGLAVPLAFAALLAVSGVAKIHTYAVHDATNELLDRNAFVADATVLRSGGPALTAQPIVDDPGLTPAAMVALAAGGQLSSFRPATAAEIAQAHFDLQVLTSPTPGAGDSQPALVAAPKGTVPDPGTGCRSVPVYAGGADLTFTVGAATAGISVGVTAPSAVSVSLTSADSPAVAGPHDITFPTGTTWLRVADPHGDVRLRFPAGTFTICNLGPPSS